MYIQRVKESVNIISKRKTSIWYTHSSYIFINLLLQTDDYICIYYMIVRVTCIYYIYNISNIRCNVYDGALGKIGYLFNRYCDMILLYAIVMFDVRKDIRFSFWNLPSLLKIIKVLLYVRVPACIRFYWNNIWRLTQVAIFFIRIRLIYTIVDWSRYFFNENISRNNAMYVYIFLFFLFWVIIFLYFLRVSSENVFI